MDTPTPNTVPTLRERVANLVLAADNAPSFGGLRQHLTEAAGFAVAVVERLEFDEKTGTMQIDQFAAMRAEIDRLASLLTAAEEAVAQFSQTTAAKLSSINEVAGQRVEALEQRLAKSESDFAELLAKLAEIESRLPEA